MRIRTAFAAAVLSLLTASSSFAWTNAAWIAPWDPNSLTSLRSNASAIAESNPVWYEWSSSNMPVKAWNAENPTWRAAMAGTKIVPTIQNTISGSGFNSAAATTMLSDATLREAHVTAIVDLVLAQGFDGIDVDYESVAAAQRANFTAFITSLSQKLHASGRTLSIAVYAKASDSENWRGPGAQDWVALGKLADSIKIMCYDYSWDGSAAGPIAPLDWIDRVTTYAESTIPAQKIIIALPFYGYDWVGTAGKTVTYADGMRIAQANGVTPVRDANGELTFSYSGGTHTVYFQDATSYIRKAWLLKQKHSSIGGFAHWCVGQEDPEVWKTLRENPSSGTVAVPAQSLPGDFTVSGPQALKAKQGQQTSGEYRMTAINGFADDVNVSIQPIGAFDGTIAVTNAKVNAASPAVTVKVATTTSTRPGVYAFAVRMVSGSLVHSQVVTLTVEEPQPSGRSRAVHH